MKRKVKIKNSKRGISLIELVVGIALVVIVFASCLGAMVGGYTTTIYNSDETRMAVLNASLNEIIITTLHNYGAVTAADVEDLIDKNHTGAEYAPTNLRLDSAIKDNVNAADGIGVVTAVYVTPDQFTSPTPVAGVDFSVRYTLVTDTVTKLDAGGTKPVEIKGVWVRTCFESANGPTFFESFVPYRT